jgi:hypothetical protein
MQLRYRDAMPLTSRVNPAVLGRLFVGWLLVIGGGILTPLPVPVGLLCLALGLALLANDSLWVRRRIRRLRARYPVFSERLAHAGRRAPRWLARAIRRTDPGAKRGP